MKSEGLGQTCNSGGRRVGGVVAIRVGGLSTPSDDVHVRVVRDKPGARRARPLSHPGGAILEAARPCVCTCGTARRGFAVGDLPPAWPVGVHQAPALF